MFGFTIEKFDVLCDTDCALRHPSSEGQRSYCEKLRGCVCGCDPIKKESIILWKQCYNACKNFSNQPRDADDFKCNFIGKDVLLRDYKMIVNCNGKGSTTTVTRDKSNDGILGIVLFLILSLIGIIMFVVPTK